MKNYLNFEADIKNLETELEKLKDPYNQEGLSEVNTDKISKMQLAIDTKLDEVYSRLVQGRGHEGDTLVALSTSGNSINVIKAVEESKRRGIKTIGLTGNAGKLEQLSDLVIKVPSDNILLIEGVHSVLLHYITEILRG